MVLRFALFIFRFITIRQLGLAEKGNPYTAKLILLGSVNLFFQ